jgi:hypothetical protein
MEHRTKIFLYAVGGLVGVAAAFKIASAKGGKRERIQAGMRFTVKDASGRSFAMVATSDQDDQTHTVKGLFINAEGKTEEKSVPLSSIISIGY